MVVDGRIPDAAVDQHHAFITGEEIGVDSVETRKGKGKDEPKNALGGLASAVLHVPPLLVQLFFYDKGDAQ